MADLKEKLIGAYEKKETKETDERAFRAGIRKSTNNNQNGRTQQQQKQPNKTRNNDERSLFEWKEKCYTCKGMGHKQKDCPSKKKGSRGKRTNNDDDEVLFSAGIDKCAR
ncbi:TPA: hypothetical protein N0F65_002822 [Lagenidium giganteum]|uniref:CCHC-type domain-containing protein n=1 Tax=Lagenidium giganteum TaxID=4803 RepID=A0AAV2ZBK7_9STRA|nr:TPA: hypothetical protein N0F65_002822 [Lagenidium giganteum]